MIDTGVDFSREELPLGKEMLVGGARLGRYLVQLFSATFVELRSDKPDYLYNLVDSQPGRDAFTRIINAFDYMNESKKKLEANPRMWDNTKTNQEALLKTKLDFLDMLPEQFGSYERNKISVALDSLFPGETEASVVQETISAQKGVMAKIKGLVGVTA